jgi:peptide chain release factor 1
VLERLEGLEEEYEAVIIRLSDPVVQSDQKALREVGKRMKELEPLVAAYRELRSATGDLGVAKEMFNDSEGADREEMRAEIDAAQTRIADLEEQLKVLLIPRDPNDGRNVIVEIRGAEGGEEANLWARDLFEMYQRYADRMGWRLEVLAADPSPMGGYNEVSFQLSGDGVWTRMKHEGGPHRVQRVPATESQGRIHTSAATVSVLPEAEEVDVHIDPSDLQIDVYRSSGAGGQSVNTTDSAVRITHKPTGIVVAMQDERSQIQNRAKAMLVLRSRMLQAEQERQAAEQSGLRKGQIGGGGRGEKIRTYNYKENRVSDHRIGLTLYKLDRVLAGELDEVVDALVADERARQLSSEIG